MKCKQCGKPAGFFKTECSDCKYRNSILKKIKKVTNTIKKDQKLPQKDAEYLAISKFVDDLVISLDEEKDRKLIMDMLTKEYSEHHSDIMIYLAVKEGVTKLTPEAEKALATRHTKRKPLIFERKPEPKKSKDYMVNGKLHREDGPAKVLPNGVKEWYLNGKLHREDGPAIEYKNDEEEWYMHGKRHREGGPAERRTNGDAWYQNGIRHRIGGPAVEFSNGSLKWFVHGKQYSKEDYEEFMDNQ
jgi:hypothetical protein